MTSPSKTPAGALYQNAEPPAHLIKVICQMIIGIGIAVALVLKIYMMILTDYQCVGDAVSLGNSIRCSPTLEIMGYGLALCAGFELAFTFFTKGLNKAIDPLILAMGSAFFLIISGLSLETANWQLALLILAMSISVGGLFYIKERFIQGKTAPATVEQEGE